MNSRFVSSFVFILGLGLWLLLGGLQAFPPAPYYTIFGTVRDEIGQPITAEDATIVLIKGSEVVLRAPVTGALIADQNYELRIPIDMLRSATTLYREEAVISRGGYLLGVEFGGQRYYPVGVASSLTAGGGSERERFDFTIGIDSDNDGLPDVWEEWQISACNIPPGPGGYDLSLLSRTGDMDKDGISDFDEYIQGTFACDGSSRLFLKFKENAPIPGTLEFSAVAGRTYRIERSTNLLNWAKVPFSVGTPGFANEAYTADISDLLTIFVESTSELRVFYRLVIQ